MNQEINVSLLNAKNLEALALKTSWEFTGQIVNTSKHFKDKNIALYNLCHIYWKKRIQIFFSCVLSALFFYYKEIDN